MIDYAAVRVGTEHEETPIGGNSFCETCGDTSDLDPASTVARLWHGDTFGIELSIEEWEALWQATENRSEWTRRRAMVAAKHERTGGPDEQELADMGRSS